MHGKQDRIIPGNAAAVNAELPFRYVFYLISFGAEPGDVELVFIFS